MPEDKALFAFTNSCDRALLSPWKKITVVHPNLFMSRTTFM